MAGELYGPPESYAPPTGLRAWPPRPYSLSQAGDGEPFSAGFSESLPDILAGGTGGLRSWRDFASGLFDPFAPREAQAQPWTPPPRRQPPQIEIPSNAPPPTPPPPMHQPQPGQTSFTNADLNWEHQYGPSRGGFATFEPGPESDFALEQRLRQAAAAEAEARTAQARLMAPATPGQPLPELGYQAQRRQQYEAAKAARETAVKEIEAKSDQMMEEFAARLGTSYKADPTGLQIKDANKRAAYVQGIERLRQHAQRAYENAMLDFAYSVDQGGFGRALMGEYGKQTGRALGREDEF